VSGGISRYRSGSYSNRQFFVVSTTSTPAKQPRLVERLALHADALSPGERRVGEYLAGTPEEAPFLSALEIAKRLGTSDATVVRAVKALGYSGLQALRDELIGDLRERATPAARLERSLEELGAQPAAILDHVLELQIGFLEEARRTVRPDDFARAVDVLEAADRVLVSGLGPTGALCEYLVLRLRRFLRQAEAVNATGLRLADSLLGFRPGDALVLVVYETLDDDTAATLARANELDVPVVLITDSLGAALGGGVAAALTAPRSRARSLSTVTTTVALFDALLLGIAARDRDRALAGLAQLNRLRERVAGRHVPLDRDLRDVDLLSPERPADT
jgi:DNA-binding MurR/RpiR family transcriptional regulator